MLSREVADVVKYLIIIYYRGWHVGSSLGGYGVHFRVTVVMDGSISMMVVVMVMMMRDGIRCVAGHAYRRTILPVLAVMMMAGNVNSFPQDDQRQDSLMAVFMIMVVMMMNSLPLHAPCPCWTSCVSPINDLDLLCIVVLYLLAGSLAYL